MSTESKSASGGIGFAGLLCIAFIVLKLTNVISWSWVWVLSPIWIPAFIGLLAVLYLVMADRNKTIWKKPKKSKWQERLDEMKQHQQKEGYHRN